MSLKRFGVSIPKDLLDEFDKLVRKRGYVGRSEAIRDAMRLFLSQADWEEKQSGNAATLTIVYQHKPSLMEKLIRAEHDAEAEVISTTHVHISQSHCLEVMTIRGERESIERLANKIEGISGITFSKLFAFTIPEDDHDHQH